MIKKLLFLFLSFLFFAFPKHAFSVGEFTTNVNVEYLIEDSGNAVVTHAITLENLFSNLYATSYSLVLDNIDVENPRAYEEGKALNLSVKSEGEKKILEVNFDEPLVGKGKTRTFTISFNNPTFAQRTGEVWEISVPRLGDEATFGGYTVTLSIPESFGMEAYVSPKPQSVVSEGKRITYLFDKESASKTGITAGFGAFQVFSFNLNYHLENPLGKRASIDIALPPDTALQKVYYQIIDPKPEYVYVDADGNWLGTYILEPRERVDIKASGSVQIFAGPRPFPKPTQETINENLKEAEFWQVSDPQIKELGRKLGTAKEIYDFVWQNLTYDYDRVKPNVTRLGAKGALENPGNAICMEFTDLFIALARAAGIPAREINGFAYTENPEIQPLSLVADVLHAWPEYWDSQTSAWIPIDPTWASTTKGVDYFSKLDLRHFTFVIHGKDPLKPYPPGSYKLGPNPQKDVFVNFGQLPEERISHPEILVEQRKPFPFMSSKLSITVKNLGPAALYNLTSVISFDGAIAKKEEIQVLPPYGVYETKISVPFTFFGAKTPGSVKITVAEKEVEVPTYKNQVIIINLVSLFFILSLFIVFVLIRLKKIRPIKIKFKFGSLLKKFKKDGDQNKTTQENPPGKV